VSGAAQSIAPVTAGWRERWPAPLAWLAPAAIAALGLWFGLVPLFRGELFLFNDNGNEYYPHAEFLTRALRSGVIPQWWPNVGLGIPVIAEGEAHYSPIRLLLAALLPAPASFMTEIALYFALVGLGTYLFLRAIRLHPLAASAGALGFMFGSHFVIELRDMGLLRAACLFPWLMWLAELSFRERRLKKVFWLAPPLLSLQYLAGNPVYSVISLLAAWVYLILRVLMDRPQARFALRMLLGWTAATSLGLGMGAVQIIPMLRHVKESVRAGGLSLEYATAYNYSKLSDFPHAFFPYAYDLRHPVLAISGFYDGALIAVAAAFALWGIRRAGPPAWALAISAVFAGAMALGRATPLFGLLWHLPFFNGFRFPNRYQFWTSFCFAAWGAIGLNRALDQNGKMAPRQRLLPFLPLALLVSVLAAGLWVTRPTMHRQVLGCVVLLAGAAWALFLLGVVRQPLALLAVLNVLLAADLAYFRNYADYAPLDSIARGLRKDGLAGLLAQDPGRFRVLSLFLPPDYDPARFREQDGLVGSAPPLWGLDSVKYHGSLELRRFERVLQGLTAALREHPEKAPEFAGFLDFLGAKYLVAPVKLAFPGWEKVGESGGMAAWRMPGFRGGEYLVGNVAREPAVADDSIVREIAAHPLDYRRTALIAPEGFETLPGLDRGPSSVDGKIERLAPRYDSMSFQVFSNRPALLVIANNYYPGWTAAVNGRPARIYRANWVGMAVPVGAGESVVEMRFRTPGFHAGVAVSLLSLALWLGMAAWRGGL